jgi:molybdopterin synthase catalytic subunit
MIQIGPDHLDPGQLLAQFVQGRTETGAIATFCGLARAEGGSARLLTLDHYPGFTESQIEIFARQAADRFGLQDWLIAHRIGTIEPGQTIVFVATAAAHRKAALEACDYLMDYLKSRAPFWKKETGPEGDRWIEPTEADLQSAAAWTAKIED